MAFIGNTNTTQAFTPAVDFFSGNASTTAFTLSRPVAAVAQVEAVISNVVQDPGSAYTVSGSTITFTSAPPSGTNNIYVRYTSPITQVIAPGQGTVSTTSLASSTGSGAVVLGTSPTIASPTISGAVMSSMASSVLTIGTTVAYTSFTTTSSNDFLSLPSWIKRITLQYYGISTNGSNSVLVQLGAGSVQSTGYVSAPIYMNAGALSNIAGSTAGIVIATGNAGNAFYGTLTFSTMGSNVWVASGAFSSGTATSIVASGGVTLSGTLDRLRITTNSADTFDAGSINILYE